MNAKYTFLVVLAVMLALGGALVALAGPRLVLFHPQGVVAARESALIVRAILIMLLVVVPVFILTAAIVWRYRAGNRGARYLPNWEHSTIEEAVWWFVPLVIIAVLAVITWRSTHALDPYKRLSSSVPPLSIEVVSLDWKWLFIYPAQGIATVNYLEIPTGTPVTFSLTADAPMNAFFIPALAGQMMTMPGMVTELNLEADAPGTYVGLSSNYSGQGFASMQFPVHAVSPGDFSAWTASVASATTTLDDAAYATLRAPSENVPAAFYRLGDPALYGLIVGAYMAPGATSTMGAMGDPSTAGQSATMGSMGGMR